MLRPNDRVRLKAAVDACDETALFPDIDTGDPPHYPLQSKLMRWLGNYRGRPFAGAASSVFLTSIPNFGFSHNASVGPIWRLFGTLGACRT